MASAAAYFDSRIWILGGITRSAANRCRVTDAVYEFDQLDGRWFQAASLWAPLAYCLVLTTAESSGEERLWLWGGMDEDGRSLGELRLWKPERRSWKRFWRLQPARHAFCGAVVGNQMCLLGGIESRFRAATDAHTQLDPAQKSVCSGCPIPYPVTGASAVALPSRESSPSLRIAQSEADSLDQATVKMRTVYRRYRQRRKVKEGDEVPDSQLLVVE
ncbi:hypothetical protein V5799_010201 [Amblyomma americanum]|uniref:F-box/kelch-repeat protein n=1 Tax=Amblyomma americanum TaxID=6943 RepID=A0AAQ4F8A8_AMBAM